jgi:hypothetical protein
VRCGLTEGGGVSTERLPSGRAARLSSKALERG